MLKILYKLFPTAFKRVAFEAQRQSIHPGDAKLKPVYFDSDGKQYYQYADVMELPVVRLRQLMIYQRELALILTAQELKDILNQLRIKIETAMEDKEKRVRELAQAVFFIDEICNREEKLIFSDTWFKIAAVTTIREDERFDEYSDEMQKKKVEIFKKDAAGGLYDFFYNTGLSKFLPCSATSTEKLQTLLTDSNKTIATHWEMLRVAGFSLEELS